MTEAEMIEFVTDVEAIPAPPSARRQVVHLPVSAHEGRNVCWRCLTGRHDPARCRAFSACECFCQRLTPAVRR